MANGYYAPFYRGSYFNPNPPAAVPYQQMPEAPQFQNQYQAPPAVQNTSDLIWVLNESEATSYPVVPGATVTLWDKNDPVIYVKSVDASGMPSMRILEFTERLPQGRAPQSAPDYVKAEEFNALKAKLNELSERVNAFAPASAATEV